MHDLAPSWHLSAAFLRFGACTVAAFGLAGCVTLRIEGADGHVEVVRSLGMLRVGLARPEQAIVGSISGVGLVGAPLGWSAGYTKQRWALLGNECRTVVWLAPGGIDESARAALARAAGVCLMAEDSDSATSTISKGTAP